MHFFLVGFIAIFVVVVFAVVAIAALFVCFFAILLNVLIAVDVENKVVTMKQKVGFFCLSFLFLFCEKVSCFYGTHFC